MSSASTKSSAARRPYRQKARAEAAEATAERILGVFARRLQTSWFDEIRLDDVAKDAGVSVQTIVRRFGSKEGLLEATQAEVSRQIVSRRDRPSGGRAGFLDAILADYEVTGDLIIRTLAQEDRYPAMRRMTDGGRAAHRRWLTAAFAPDLEALPTERREAALDALVVATDVYVWKLLRRDMGRPVADLRALMQALIDAALSFPRPDTGDTR